jgi:glycosyltransferase involved in cell wall biosynthesis
MTEARLLQIFNVYLERGGEEASVERIFALLRQELPVERCTFSSRAWRVPKAPPIWKQAAWMLWNPASLRKLREVQASYRANLWLVHNVFPVGSAAIFREALAQRIPVLYYIHNFRPFSVNGYLWAGNALAPGGLRRNYWREIRHGAWQNSRLKTAWFAFVLHALRGMGWLRAIKGWIAISEFMRQCFIEAGVPAEDIFTIPHFWNARPEPSLRDDGYFLFLGRLIAPKGLAVLFEAWRLIEDELGEDAPRLIIGGMGPLDAEIRTACAASRRVEFAGYVSGEQKSGLIAGCAAMLAPSLWWEPLGLVTYEAYDYGKPILAARSGGLTETVIDGSTGLLHTPGDARELANHVIRLHRDPGLRREMGSRGRTWLLENAGEALWLERFQKAVSYVLAKNS